MPLSIDVGSHTLIGPKLRNEDALGVVTPEQDLLMTKGVAVVVADGVSGCEHGDEAAKAVVKGILADYYATPETWAIPQALDRVLTALNRWLAGQNGQGQQRFVSTMAVWVARGQRYVIGHAGDTRVYRYRQDQLQLLTTDHVWDRPGMQHVLKRAIGLDDNLVVDFSEGQLQVGDVFLLVTDGVWEPLGDLRLHQLLQLHDDPQCAAAAITQAAQSAGSQDNMSCVVLRVAAMATETFADRLAGMRHLPLPGRLRTGTLIDDFEVLRPLHESRSTRLLLVQQQRSGRRYVLKTLQPQLAPDETAQAALLTEEWLGKKLTGHYFPQILPLVQRSTLYYVMSWHEGQTLAQRAVAGQRFSIAEVTTLGIRLGKALGVLHRLNILHRDIKPENLLLTNDDKLKVLDLGVASCPGLTVDDPHSTPGTPSYMAPELFAGQVTSVQSDLYAAGVTLYWLLTAHYPYGEIEPFQHPRFGDPVPPTRYRPDIPVWLENALLKAVARDPKLRFETAEEWGLVMERGEHQPVFTRRVSPLAERQPLRVWQSVSGILLILNLLLLYLLVAR
ncbi:bifunctional protein-serine/threonine kinase/phosphatase [Chitinivorax sp. B]|uniref:bifunctional protein-serine/threonine kinase/phosphatase n=1 Tax=Chitinivorax sp. B TaxID=2502235 RepID=UPI0010F58523|nr:bifunctional protein-serine/threonine kinase/phosphatase [Chitinivorax sp. B]